MRTDVFRCMNDTTPNGSDLNEGSLSGGASWRRLAAIIPEWSAPPGVQAFVTGRSGGTSTGPWGLDGDLPGGLNLGTRCGDSPAAVAENRARLAALLPSAPRWLNQVHGVDVHLAGGAAPASHEEPLADAAITDRPGTVVAVLTADCLPVFLADTKGRVVGVAHAGWRGLAGGVLENTVAAMRVRLPDNASLQAWLGPAIGPDAFEVGDEVRAAFCERDAAARSAFRAGYRPGKWFADLSGLARLRLRAAGVARIDGCDVCTYIDRSRFWSYRRRAESGRMASVIWFAR
jgi:YfiH family protein